MNVLIVDDDPDITKLYSTALEGEGFERIELNSLVHYEKYDITKQLVS